MLKAKNICILLATPSQFIITFLIICREINVWLGRRGIRSYRIRMVRLEFAKMLLCHPKSNGHPVPLFSVLILSLLVSWENKNTSDYCSSYKLFGQFNKLVLSLLSNTTEEEKKETPFQPTRSKCELCSLGPLMKSPWFISFAGHAGLQMIDHFHCPSATHHDYLSPG